MLIAVGLPGAPDVAGSTRPSPALEKWTVARIADRGLTVAAVGDGKHFWTWDPEGSGIELRDSTGRVLSTFHANVRIENVAPLGDGKRALVVPSDQPGALLVVGLSSADARRVPELEAVLRAQPEPTAADVSVRRAKTGSFVQLSLGNSYPTWFWADGAAGPGTLLATLENNRNVVVLNDTLVRRRIASGERAPSSDFQLELITPSRSPVIVTIRLQALSTAPPRLSSFSPLGTSLLRSANNNRGVWLVSRRHRGAAYVDVVDALMSAVEAGGPYQASTIFPDDQIRVQPGPDGTAWVCDEPTTDTLLQPSRRPPLGLVYVTTSNGIVQTPIAEFKAQSLSSVSALTHDSGLVSVRVQDRRRYVYVKSDGTVRDLRTDSERPSLLRAFADRRGRNFIISGSQSTTFELRLDEQRLELKPHPRDSDVTVEPDSGVWIVGTRGTYFFDAESGEIERRTRPLFSRVSSGPDLTPIGDSRHVIASIEDDGTFLVDRRDSSTGIELRLGPSELTSATTAIPKLHVDPNTDAPKITARLTGWPGIAANDGTTISMVIAQNGKPLVRFKTFDVPNHDAPQALYRDPSLTATQVELGTAVDLTARVTDTYGTSLEWTWPGIKFEPPIVPFFQRPWVVSVLVFLALVVFTTLAASLRGGLVRWAPSAVYLFGGVASTVFLGRIGTLDATTLAGLLLLGIIVVTIAGFYSPRLFVELERMEPFRFIAPWAVALSAFRRRFYAAHVRTALQNLELSRRQANNEQYSVIPIDVLDQREISLNATLSPPVQVLDTLSHQHGHVLVESTGGRGKSALVREVVRLGLTQFETKPSSPLPVVLDGLGAGSLYDRTRSALGVVALSDELLKALLRSGDYVLVIDGLSESNVTRELLANHVAAYGTDCPLLLSTRPVREMRGAIEQTERWLILEPSPLDDETLSTFLQTYGFEPESFDEQLRQVCRSADGTYLPILVRLALMSRNASQPASGAQLSIARIYQDAVRSLLGTDVAFDETVDLCLSTYWETGDRALTFATAPSARKELLRRMMKTGLLISAERGLREDEPQRVKFFHDSVQSYLTAVGLDRARDWEKRLPHAAANPRFLIDHAESSRMARTEIFNFFLQVCQREPDLRRVMRDRIMEYADEYGGAFSRNWIVEALAAPEAVFRIGPRVAGGAALVIAADYANEQQDVTVLGTLYARVVRHLWRSLDEEKTSPGGAVA